MLNSPLPGSALHWRNDPASFSGFPEFFLAHELAHQWWGQAVGWRNYHEQWLSEGFAQYFAALYARTPAASGCSSDMLRQFRRWAIAESDEGPDYPRLPARTHQERAPRCSGRSSTTRAPRCCTCCAGWSATRRSSRGSAGSIPSRSSRKAGTDDLRRAFEAESGRPLERFFDRWIYGAAHSRASAMRARCNPASVAVRFEQIGERDLRHSGHGHDRVYADGRTQDVVVPVTERRVDGRLSTDGAVRQVVRSTATMPRSRSSSVLN